MFTEKYWPLPTAPRAHAKLYFECKHIYYSAMTCPQKTNSIKEGTEKLENPPLVAHSSEEHPRVLMDREEKAGNLLLPSAVTVISHEEDSHYYIQ